MRFAYADPPYLGQCGRYEHRHEAPYSCWDLVETHRVLIARLEGEFPDGWALSCSTPSLHDLVPLLPREARFGAWFKPFAVFKPNVGLAYAWEPIILRGGRRITRGQPTVRDWVSANITLKRGLTGAKPEEVCMWLFRALGLGPDDEFVDVFPGSGAVGRAWERFRSQLSLAVGA